MVPRGIDVCVCYPRVCYMLRHSLSSSLFLFGCLVSTRLGGGGGITWDGRITRLGGHIRDDTRRMNGLMAQPRWNEQRRRTSKERKKTFGGNPTGSQVGLIGGQFQNSMTMVASLF